MQRSSGRRYLSILVVTALLAGGAFSAADAADRVRNLATLRVMLNPDSAPDGVVPPAVRERLEAMAGVGLVPLRTTRTGAVEFAVAGPRGADQLAALAARLRTDRSVLWAESGQGVEMKPRAALRKAAAEPAGRKLLVRFASGVDPAAELSRLSTAAGVLLAAERTLGNVTVVGLPQKTSMTNLEAVAGALEADAVVRYADPVRRVRTSVVPNDPLFGQQWSLPALNASGAWDLGTGNSNVTVAVIDTGILDHPELAGRLLPGYDFITDPVSARDGDARDPNPRDEGDWSSAEDCGLGYAEDSFFHGLFVAGQIAANANNGEGIAGLDWSAKILPVRVLGRCGGTFEDVLAGLLWASGVPVEGAPVNPYPARVINMSLGGFGACAGAIQEAVDQAIAQGSVIVAAAGNESDDAGSYSPGNCSGVINVGALSRLGDRAGYSNFGRRVDVSAPGGDGDADGLILSTLAEGTTTPGAFSFGNAMGTSFAAPLVSGTVSLMLARNPNLTVGQVQSIVQGASNDFPVGSSCAVGGFCGLGALNAYASIASTMPATEAAPPGSVAVLEFYNAARDHYLVTADAAEIAAIGADSGWQATGAVFYAWPQASSAPAGTAPLPVCRFYASDPTIASHYFTANASECNYVIAQQAATWTLETRNAFWIEVPSPEGTCRTGTLPVYRFFNNRRDANQRHTIDLSVRRAMINRVWVPDGPGASGVAFCSPI